MHTNNVIFVGGIILVLTILNQKLNQWIDGLKRFAILQFKGVEKEGVLHFVYLPGSRFMILWLAGIFVSITSCSLALVLFLKLDIEWETLHYKVFYGSELMRVKMLSLPTVINILLKPDVMSIWLSLAVFYFALRALSYSVRGIFGIPVAVIAQPDKSLPPAMLWWRVMTPIKLWTK
jgi:hypothetical protein